MGHPAQITGGCCLCRIPVDIRTAVRPTAHPCARCFLASPGQVGAWPRGAGGLPPPPWSRGKHEQQESGQDISSACAEMDPPCRPSAPSWRCGVGAEPATRWQCAGASLLGNLLPGPGAAARAPPAPGTVLPASLVEEHPLRYRGPQIASESESGPGPRFWSCISPNDFKALCSSETRSWGRGDLPVGEAGTGCVPSQQGGVPPLPGCGACPSRGGQTWSLQPRCPRAAVGAVRPLLFRFARTKRGCTAAPARPGAAHRGSQPPGLPGRGGGHGGCGVGRVNAEISTPWRKHYRMHVCCHLHIEIYPKGPSFGKFCFLLYLPIEGRKLFIIKK